MSGDAPSATAEDASSCLPGGEFRLRVACGSSYLVLACTEDSAAATIPVVTAIGEERALPATHLDAGLAISGTVTSGGTVGSGLRVVASSSNPPTMPAEKVRAFFRWSASGFVRIEGGGQTDALGRFTISGLSPGEFGVLAQGCAVPVQLTPVPTSQTPRVTVTAPAENVAIPLYCSVIEFHLVGVDPAPDEVAATISDAGSDSFGFSAPWSPVQRIGFAPNREAHLSFRIEGCEPFEANFTFPGPGEQRIEVVQLVPISPARLRVHLTTQTGEPVDPDGLLGVAERPGGTGVGPPCLRKRGNGRRLPAKRRPIRGLRSPRAHGGVLRSPTAGYECESARRPAPWRGRDSCSDLDRRRPDSRERGDGHEPAVLRGQIAQCGGTRVQDELHPLRCRCRGRVLVDELSRQPPPGRQRHLPEPRARRLPPASPPRREDALLLPSGRRRQDERDPVDVDAP